MHAWIDAWMDGVGGKRREGVEGKRREGVNEREREEGKRWYGMNKRGRGKEGQGDGHLKADKYVSLITSSYII